MTIIFRDVTPDDAAALAHVLVPASEHAFRGLLPDSEFEFTEAQSEANWRRFLGGEGLPADDFMILALSDGKVVGYTWGGLNEPDAEYRGEIRQLYLSPEYQRHGIGRLLVCQLIHRFAERHVHSLCVWTLKINPNRVFYERLGAVFVREFLYEAENFTEPGWIYGWADTSPLLKFCDSPS